VELKSGMLISTKLKGSSSPTELEYVVKLTPKMVRLYQFEIAANVQPDQNYIFKRLWKTEDVIQDRHTVRLANSAEKRLLFSRLFKAPTTIA
jgi:hypothetical protein